MILNVAYGLIFIGLPFDAFADLDTTPSIILPEIKRDAGMAPILDTEKIETTSYIGAYKMDGFRAEPVVGIRIAYHLSPLLFMEGSFAKIRAKDISLENMGRASVFEDEAMHYLNLSLGFNLLPGQMYVGKNRSINTDFYVKAGFGQLSVDDDNLSSLHIGAGLRAIPTDWLSIHMDMRSYFLNKSFLDPDDYSHNIEYTFGVGLIF